MSAVLRYPNDTMLHCSSLVESNKQLHSNQTDYAKILADQIIALDAKQNVCVDEDHTD